jgi:hypothetical protein
MIGTKGLYVGGQIAELVGGRRLHLPGAIIPDDIEDEYGSFTVSPNASAHTKGLWVQIVAALAHDCYGIFVSTSHGDNNMDYLYDIGVGADGAEVVVVPDVLLSTPVNERFPSGYLVPIFIPRGSRVAARCQADGTTAGGFTARCCIIHNRFDHLILRRSESIGVSVGGSDGTSIDPGGTANTKPGYTVLTASTSRRIRRIFATTGNRRNLTRSTYQWKVDIAVGGAGTEVIFAADLPLGTNAASDFVIPGHFGTWTVDIPAGSRIVARAECTGIDGTDRLFQLACYGFSE